MAPISLEAEISYTSVGLVVGQLVAAVFLSFEVGRSLYRSYRSLGPAQDTRERRHVRSTLIPVFATLACVSLCSVAYTAQRHATLSYKVWATLRDIEIPSRFYGDDGIFPFGEKATSVYITRWLSDVPYHLDALEIAAEKARRFWWGQQIDLGFISWSMLVAVEGRRRNMPLLWAYLSLGQLVSLSFAQNLFFIALLLTPTPLPVRDGGALPVSRYVRVRNAVFPPKPANWKPHAAFYVVPLVMHCIVTGSKPFLANTPSVKVLAIAGRLLGFTPLIVPNIIPVSWGVQHTHPHEAYATYCKLFKLISTLSFLLHAKATAVGLAYNAPAAHQHRHSTHLPFDIERRSSWERTTSGFGRVLGATADHPVMGGIGWDVLLSTLSIGLWAAVRTIDVTGILATTMPLYELHRDDVDEVAPRKPWTSDGDGKAGASGSRAVRKRGRPRKSLDKSSDDAAYEPTPSVAASVLEGDALPAERRALDWEAAALAWGLTVIGGLGVGSAGVLGGECIAR